MFDIYTIRRMNSSGELTQSAVMDRYGVKRHQVKRAANNSWKVYLDGEQAMAYIYHRTEVVSVYLDGRVKLNTGGWDTVTTRDRLNRFQNVCGIWSERGDWYVRVYEGGGKKYSFSDGMTIHKDGRVEDGLGRPMEPLPEGSETKAARMGNLITQGIYAWQRVADGGEPWCGDLHLYTIIDKLEAMGMERSTAWDIMDPHVHEPGA